MNKQSNEITLKKGENIKKIKIGFSWTTFFFGFFVPLFRKDWLIGIINLIITIFLFNSYFFLFIVIQTGFSSVYNKMYIKNLINKNWEPADETDRKILTKKGIIFSKEEKNHFSETEAEISECNKYGKNSQNTHKTFFKQIKDYKISDTVKNIFNSFYNSKKNKVVLTKTTVIKIFSVILAILIILSISSFLFKVVTNAVTGTFSKGTGVYAGRDFYNSNKTLYLRNDGTYTWKLNSSDWKTHVDGTYKIKGKTLYLKEKNGNTSDYSFTADMEALTISEYYIFKTKILNKVPDGTYSFVDTSTVNNWNGDVSGSRVDSSITFKGNTFSTYASSSLYMGSPNAIVGNSSGPDKTSGTYTLKNGDLILKYNNGKISKHSFFYLPPTSSGKAGGIVFDGVIYFDEK